MDIQFGSRINFVTESSFQHLPLAKANRVLMPYEAEQIIITKKGCTDDIAFCLGGGIVNGVDALLFHLNPTNSWGKKLDKVQDVFEKGIKSLSDKSEPCSALLIGGYLENPTSASLFKEIKKFLDKFHLKPTVFWGQKKDMLIIFTLRPMIHGKYINWIKILKNWTLLKT